MLKDLRLIAISGMSASGKTTLQNGLLKKLLGAKILTSTTTRLQRSDDQKGDYEYVSESTYIELESNGAFLTGRMDSKGCSYGMLIERIESALSGEDIFIRPVGPSVIPAYHKIGKKKILFLHILAPRKGILAERLKARGVDSEIIESRLNEEADWDKTIFEMIDEGIPIQIIDGNHSIDYVLRKALRFIQE